VQSGSSQGKACPWISASITQRHVQNVRLSSGNSSDGAPTDGESSTDQGLSLSEWISRHGHVSPTVPVTSRARWITLINAWAITEHGGAALAVAHVSLRAFLLIAAEFAGHCDARTGRWIAVTNATIATGAGYCTKRVTTVRAILARNGWAVEAARGVGRAHGRHNRPSVWHLTTPRAATKPTDRPVDNPPPAAPVFHPLCSSSVSDQSSVRFISPTRARAREASNTTCDPQPLAAHKLAAGLLARTIGLDRGHCGGIVRAIANSHLELDAWTPWDLKTALDLSANGLPWPNAGGICHPPAFLAWRLKRLPSRPERTPGPPRYVSPEPPPVTGSATQRARAHIAAVLGARARNRHNSPTSPFQPQGRTFDYV
jgi:hypothetical protein